MKNTTTGIAWFRPEQWRRLLEISADRERLEDTYEEWEKGAVEGMRNMESMGLRVEKVVVDVEELLSWCKENGLAVNSESRARYAAEILRKRNEA